MTRTTMKLAQGPLQMTQEEAFLSPGPGQALLRMLSPAEVGLIFGRAPRTIRHWIARGLFQPIKVGNAVFIPQAQIDALLTAPKRLNATKV